MIYIVCRHPPHSYYRSSYMDAFTIVATCATRAEAKRIAEKKNASPGAVAHFSVNGLRLPK